MQSWFRDTIALVNAKSREFTPQAAARIGAHESMLFTLKVSHLDVAFVSCCVCGITLQWKWRTVPFAGRTRSKDSWAVYNASCRI